MIFIISEGLVMLDIIIRASYFILMIAVSYLLKRAGILSKEDGVAIARVVLNLTLPCAVLVSFRSFVFDWSYMLIPLISFMSNILMLSVGFMISRGKSREERIFYMLELSAYNIGNFTLAFVTGLLSTAGVVASCLFDMGNSPMSVAINAVITQIAIGDMMTHRRALRSLLSVFTRPAFDAYIIMLVFSALPVSLPDRVFEFAGLISPANGPLAMIMIGLMLEFKLDKSKLKEVVVVNVLRLLLAVAIAFLFFRFAPFPYDVRKAVAITAFAPISSASPAFVAEMKGDVALVGFASTVSIALALILMPFLFAFL